MMFCVVNTFVVIDTSKGKINTIAIDKPTFVVLSNFLNVFIIYWVLSYLLILYILVYNISIIVTSL